MVKLVGEIGTNHNGSLETAREMARVLADAGFWAVKGQYRTPDPAWKDKPYGHISYSYGPTYWDHRMAVDLTQEEHLFLASYCRELGLEYFVSVWDSKGVDFASSLSEWIKVPSALNDCIPVLARIGSLDSRVIISAGMIGPEDLMASLLIIPDQVDYVLATTCSYPTEYQDMNLRRVESLRDMAEEFVNISRWTFQVGLSGHHTETDSDLVAIGMGATMIERHFTLSKEYVGPDHAMSLNPKEVMELGEKVHKATQAMGSGYLGLLEAEKKFARKVGRITEEE